MDIKQSRVHHLALTCSSGASQDLDSLQMAVLVPDLACCILFAEIFSTFLKQPIFQLLGYWSE